MVFLTIEGVVAPVFTPITDDGELNLDVIPEYSEYLASNGVKSILVGGTTGEAVSLSVKERKQLLDAWMTSCQESGMSVIAQVGGVPMPEVLEMAKYAECSHVDAIMTLPEIYYKPRTSEQLVKYLKEVSDAAPSSPLIYYHFPMMSGVEVNIPEFFAIATSKIPNFKGMKADLGVAVLVADKMQEGQRIFIGNHMLAPAVLMGHESSIATVTNIFPLLVNDIVSSVKNGEVRKSKEMQKQMNRVVEAIASHGDFLPTMKAAMEIVTGIKVGPPRIPLSPIAANKKDLIKDGLASLGYTRN